MTRIKMQSKKLMRVMTSAVSFGLIEGQLGFLIKNGFEVHTVAGGDEKCFIKRSVKEGFSYTILPHLVRPISIFNDIVALKEMIQEIHFYQPDILHANTPKGSLLAMIAGKLCGVKHRVYTVTGLRFEGATGIHRWILKTIERITCACATRVIPEGRGVAATLKKEKITSKNLSILHNGNINGVALDYFNPNIYDVNHKLEILEKLGLNSKDFIIVFVGRLVKDKGIIELLDAFLKVQKEFSEAKLLLVGPYYEMEPLPNNIKQCISENSSIIHTGRVVDVRPFLSIANIFILPSYREGFPNSVLEASAMNLPCIVTDISGANEIIIHRINGLVVPTKDTQALYQAISELINSPELISNMSSSCRSNIVEKYKREDVWKETLMMYIQLLLNS